MSRSRVILHVDMDAFYASVEQHDNPALAGKPVLVGGTGPRGVVAAASYETRAFGVHSAMPMRAALQRCPDAICVRPRMARYQEVSRVIFGTFREFTPLVQGLSLDEAFLDVTDSESLHGDAVGIARQIRRRIREATGLTASVGIGPNKLVAKVASDLGKPDGLHEVTPEQVRSTLDPLPVRVVGGIGPRTAEALQVAGIRTLRELREAPEQVLGPIFGRFVSRMQQRAAGVDDRLVEASVAEKSISSEETFDQDIGEFRALAGRLLSLSDRTAARVRRKGLMAGRVTVKIRQADFKTQTRQRSLNPPSNDSELIYHTAAELLQAWWQEHPGVQLRLLGVGVSELFPDRQLDLFQYGGEESPERIDSIVDRIRQRFGEQALRRGGTLKS